MIQPVKKLHVRSLTVKGFKGFSAETSFTFGDMNTITGHNGQGKSSIADAIAFAITGVSFYGGTKLDHLYHTNTRDISIIMEFSDESGAVRRLSRKRVNDNNVVQSVQGKGFNGKISAGGQERAGKSGYQAAQNASRFHPVFLAHVNIQNSQGGPHSALHRFNQRRAGGVCGDLYIGGQLQRRRCQRCFYGLQLPLFIVTNGNQHSLTSLKRK